MFKVLIVWCVLAIAALSCGCATMPSKAAWKAFGVCSAACTADCAARCAKEAGLVPGMQRQACPVE